MAENRRQIVLLFQRLVVCLPGILAASIAIAIAPSCRPTSPPGPIDSTLSSCVPPGTVALAGINVDQLRSTPLYQSLPASTFAALEILRDTSYLLLASNGKDLLLIARGKFREAPPGATLISANLAIAGTADTIRDA